MKDTGRDGEGRMLGASGIDLWQQHDFVFRPPFPALADAGRVTTLREVRIRALHSHGVVGHVDEHVVALQVAAATLDPDNIARSRGQREGVRGGAGGTVAIDGAAEGFAPQPAVRGPKGFEGARWWHDSCCAAMGW